MDMQETGKIAIEENTDERFVVDTPEKANWVIKKVKEIRAGQKIYNDTIDLEIAELNMKKKEYNEKRDTEAASFLYMLNPYLDCLPARKTKTRMTFELPAGKLVRKLAHPDFEKNDDKLVEYLQENAPEYIKNEPKARWGEFKKQLCIQGSVVVRKDTGEVLKCVSVIEKPESFDVE